MIDFIGLLTLLLVVIAVISLVAIALGLLAVAWYWRKFIRLCINAMSEDVNDARAARA